MDTQDQSSQQGSQQELLVIHAALFRMGTKSFADAYRILGYKVHHGVEDVRGNPWARIEQAAEATWPSISGPKHPFTKQDWDSLWGSKYDIVTDMASPFVPQLIEAYPNAKVVVVQRDYESWWESFSSQLLDTLFSRLVDVVVFFDWYINGVRAGYAMRKVHFGFFGASSREEIEVNSRATYDKYYERIRQMVPPERRLEYRFGDGWEPLCDFLGKDIPDVPFPRVNKRKAHKDGVLERQNDMVRKTTRKVLPWILVLLVIPAAIWYR
ncbi:hypothetical protein F5Y18DRAFT_433607 [Xylariaceae sp. FL1019]|nr:hypothetical protein F5Y18DRAFT_433607 [Xylariaceae sp. FL1019]